MQIWRQPTTLVPTMAALAGALLVAQGPTQTSAPQIPTFQSGTDFVTTTIYARDDDGQFVGNLTREDFRVFEDGVEQRIALFQPVIGGRVIASDVPGAAAPAANESLILPSTPPPADSAGRIFIIFIDDMHLEALDTGRARRILERIRDTLIHDTDLVALVSTGYSSIATDLAYDYGHRRFNDALNKVVGSAMSPTDVLSSANLSDGPAKVRFDAHVAFRTAYDMLEQLGRVTNRRKSFVYLSTGYDFNPYTDSRYEAIKNRYYALAGSTVCPDSTDEDPFDLKSRDLCDNPFLRDGNQFSDADLLTELNRLARAARRANVVFYTVDPRGLVANPSIEYQLSVAEWQEHLNLTTSTLHLLGDETGGFCICQTNDYTSGLERIDNETSDYYILGYNSNNPDRTQVRRRIEIRTDRPNVGLVYREEYVLEPRTSP